MISSDWRSQIFEKKKKKIRGSNLGSKGLNQTQNEVFRYFLEFGWLVFHEIAYNYSLEQCLTSSSGKTHKKILGPKFGIKLDLIHHFLNFGSLVFF